MALLAVMVVILLVALAAYSFNQRMADAYRVSSTEMERVQARLTAQSGVEVLLREVSQPRDRRMLDGARQVFVGPVAIDQDASGTDTVGTSGVLESDNRGWQFSIIAPMSGAAGRDGGNGGGLSGELRAERAGWRWGVVNESSKLNFEMLRRWEGAFPGSARKALSQLPGATSDLVDGLVDAFGLTTSAASVGRMEAIRERLQQRGGSGASPQQLARQWSQLWTGGDWNYDYRLDGLEEAIALSGESYGEEISSDTGGAGFGAGSSSGGDNAVPVAWRDYLTFASGQRNERRNGQPRVFLNGEDLSRLRRELLATWPASWVDFVIAARQYGLASSGTGSGTVQSAANWTPDLSVAAKVPIESPLALIDARVRIPAGASGTNSDGEIVLQSPFSSASDAQRDYLGRLLDDVTVDANTVLVGQVDVMTAPVEVLRAVPSMSAEAAEQIVRKRQSSPPAGEPRDTLAWLVRENVMTLASLRPLLPWLTVGGDCYSCQVVGWRDARSAMYRCTVVVDGLTRPAKLRHLQQWHAWGRGFAPSEFAPEAISLGGE